MLIFLLAFITVPPPDLLPVNDIVWERKPTGAEVAQVLPTTTARPWTGSFKLYCVIQQSGWLRDCSAPGLPDGAPPPDSLVKIARYFKAAPLSRSGTPTAGRMVAIPISFSTADS